MYYFTTLLGLSRPFRRIKESDPSALRLIPLLEIHTLVIKHQESSKPEMAATLHRPADGLGLKRVS